MTPAPPFPPGAETPYEDALFEAEVGHGPEGDPVYRLTYDGSVADVQLHGVMGGQVDQVESYLAEHYSAGLDRTAAIKLAADALGALGPHVGEQRVRVARVEQLRGERMRHGTPSV